MKIDLKNSKVLDTNSGEIIDNVKLVGVKEDNKFKTVKFVKVFVEDLSAIFGLSSLEYKLLFKIIQMINYENVLLVPKYIKDKMAKELGVNPLSVNNSIRNLTNKGLLAKLTSGAYKVNPHYFGKGKWDNIQKVTMTWDAEHEDRVINIIRKKEDNN